MSFFNYRKTTPCHNRIPTLSLLNPFDKRPMLWAIQLVLDEANWRGKDGGISDLQCCPFQLSRKTSRDHTYSYPSNWKELCVSPEFSPPVGLRQFHFSYEMVLALTRQVILTKMWYLQYILFSFILQHQLSLKKKRLTGSIRGKRQKYKSFHQQDTGKVRETQTKKEKRNYQANPADMG